MNYRFTIHLCRTLKTRMQTVKETYQIILNETASDLICVRFAGDSESRKKRKRERKKVKSPLLAFSLSLLR